MEFDDPLLGKRLTAVSVFEPWKVGGTKPYGAPLSGAIVLEFGDVAVLFRSPLRYSRVGLYAPFTWFTTPDALKEVAADYRAIVCDSDGLALHQRALEGVTGQTQPSLWHSVLPESSGSLALDNMPDWQQLAGEALLGMSQISETVFELRFSGGQDPLLVRYREDLDGAIQAARVGGNFEMAEIAVSKPDHAFGWLHPAAPYPICAKGKLWPNIERYIESAVWGVTRARRPRHDLSEMNDQLLALHEEALRLKFDAHPTLSRRLAAIRYPIVGNGIDDCALQALHRFRMGHSKIEPM